MNQILNFKKNSEDAGTSVKPATKFFAVIIILFALILIGEGIYNVFFNQKNDNKNITPTISTIQEGSNVIVTAENRIGLDKVIYSWNNGEEAIIQANGNSKVQEKISLPIGKNKLNLSVVDSKGRMTRFSSTEFTFDSSIDSNKPNIEVTKGTSTGTIKIIATDDKGLKKLTYQWNDDDVIAPEIQEGIAIFEVEVAAKEGERTIKIKAIDTSDNEQTVTKTIKGSKKPEITVQKDGQYLVINAKDDDKLGKIEYDLNGTTKTIYNINESTYEFKLDLVSGENRVIVTAYDVDGLSAVYKGKCNY